MPDHRLFLAIKLPSELLARLVEYQRQIDPRLFRLVEKTNLHLTLIFLGYIAEEKIPIIQDIVADKVKNFQSPAIEFFQTSYGPNPKFPRLIWLQGAPNQKLKQLKRDLEQELQTKAGANLKEGSHPFLPHITLARIKPDCAPQLPQENKIQTLIRFSFSPKNLWIMESRLLKDGAQYLDLAKFDFL